jgi:uncharacterized protein
MPRLLSVLCALVFVATGVLARELSRVEAAPSFDCKRASSIAEKEICGLPELKASTAISRRRSRKRSGC